MSNVHIGEKYDNYSKDDIVATNQIIDALLTCKKMLRTQKEGEIYSVRTQMASCALCTKSNMRP
jgi:predicted metal-binding protein